jgi:hypothetical protein
VFRLKINPRYAYLCVHVTLEYKGQWVGQVGYGTNMCKEDTTNYLSQLKISTCRVNQHWDKERIRASRHLVKEKIGLS